ncbi:MAG: restriction endonuclease subunit S [Candidatus Thermoplasmatota archaeon]|nr:restriction endonuclease subunit S [Candidatus Thermoplasmatota archaeon]
MTNGPYELPAGWCWVTLGEVCEVRSGIWGPEASDEASGFPVIRSTEISGMRLNAAAASVRSIPAQRVDAYALKTGDILVNKSSGSPQLVGWPAIFEDPGDGRTYFFSNFMLRLRLSEPQAIPWFLLYYLHSPSARANYLGAQATTSGLRNLRIREFIVQLVPLPPLEEQRRIVARIEELMGRIREARRLREEAKRDADHLMPAALAEVFPRPGSSLPPAWRWVKLGEVVEYERRSMDPRRYPERTFCLYSIPAYDNGNMPEEFVGANIGSSKLLIEPGVCLFSKLNPRLPRAWVVTEAHRKHQQLASTEFMPLKPRMGVLDLGFLGRVLLSECFLQQVRRDVTGATGSRQRLKPNVVLGALIPLPPLSEQRRIVAHLEAVQEKTKALEQAQAETDAELRRLEQSILAAAFRGEL